MARYTSSYTVGLPFPRIGKLVVEVLESCPLEITYDTGEYIMAREIPGKVSYSKLVSVEILIDRTTSTEKETKMTLVVKNEELPLQVENHCYQMFQLVSQAIVDYRSWQIIEQVAG
ncbi:hypothetical protein ACE1B6_08975 [Aerosakkonemataceae cyanobacterium BLCC-F154]|uniref:Uncharacterized protein n=1 Tax=Floridaenema fluviatile BLCC-F154 TaxID=3153640 RepID=A0ABV4YB94_9CYAN